MASNYDLLKPQTPEPGSLSDFIRAGVNVPVRAGMSAVKAAANLPRAAFAPVVDTAANMFAGAFGGKRTDPYYFSGEAYKDLGDAASGITQPFVSAGKNIAQSVRDVYGFQPANALAPVNPPAPAPAAENPVVETPKQENPVQNNTVLRDPFALPTMANVPAKEGTSIDNTYGQIKGDNAGNLSSQIAEYNAQRAAAIDELNAAKNLDTKSIGSMIVSGAKNRRRGMVANALLKNLADTDPNKIAADLAKTQMAGEYSLAGTKLTASSSAAEKAKDRQLKAILEGPKAETEARTNDYIAQHGLEDYLSRIHPSGGEFTGIANQNTGLTDVISKKTGAIFPGGMQNYNEQQLANYAIAELTKIQGDKKAQEKWKDENPEAAAALIKQANKK